MDFLWTLVEEVHPSISIGLIEAVEEDRERAPHLLVELLSYPPVLRWQMAVTLVRFRSVALAGLLVDLSRERRAAGEELAELALAILGVLDPWWRVLIDQGRARAWGALANTHRLKGNLARAEAAFFRASVHLANAPDPIEEARFYRLRARSLRDQGKLEEAIGLQNRAVRSLTRFATPGLVGEALVELASLYKRAGDEQQTLIALARASAAFEDNE
jgi:tetratricopeptide (TPR) repeat protein